MIYGLILAAGKQSRYGSDVPKALANIGNRTLLDINIERLSSICDEVYVVCSYQNEGYFTNYSNRIVIESGKGCGDAVLKAIKALPHNEVDTCIIQWGDSLVETGLYTEMLDRYTGKWIIPCEISDLPYVQIFPTDGSVKISFSKYGEHTAKGFHDLSVFYGPMAEFERMASQFEEKYLDGETYVHKHGNEFQFLDIFNDTPLEASAYHTAYKGYAFNTLDELSSLLSISEVNK